MLPRQYRLRKDRDFQKIWKRGQSYRTKFFRFKILKNNLIISRFGIVVGTKVSKKTTIRNQTKRRAGEIIRLKLSSIKPCYDLILTALPMAVHKKYPEIEKDILSALEYFKILKA